MGYDIFIGQAELRFTDSATEDGLDEPGEQTPEWAPKWVVKRVERPDAPRFPHDDLTGTSNHRHPGYTAWTEFACAVGLDDLFFNERTGLMREHPGCFRLTQQHAVVIGEALRRWRERYPTAVPAFTLSPHLAQLTQPTQPTQPFTQPPTSQAAQAAENHSPAASGAGRNESVDTVDTVVFQTTPPDTNREGDSESLEAVQNAALARLIWLDDWVRWALSACSHPALYNT